MKKIAIAGFGTVGGGIAHLLRDNQKVLAGNAGENISLGAILVRSKKADSEFAHLMTTDFTTIEKDEDICLVAEAIGGERISFVDGEPSYITVILNAIARSELFERIDRIDCTSARNACAVADGRFTLIFGGTSELELKLKVAAEYLDIERVASAKSATLDLTSPKEVIVTIND